MYRCASHANSAASTCCGPGGWPSPSWPGPPLWVHGDLHPANLLVTADGTLRAVLDFGDVTAGDPAVDLATAWLTFDELAQRVSGRRATARRVERRA